MGQLESVEITNDSKLKRINNEAFSQNMIKKIKIPLSVTPILVNMPFIIANNLKMSKFQLIQIFKYLINIHLVIRHFQKQQLIVSHFHHQLHILEKVPLIFVANFLLLRLIIQN